MRSFKISKEIYTARTDNINRYFEDIKNIPLLTPEEEYETGMLAKGGCEKSRTKLVESNLKFAISVAKSYQQANGILSLIDFINDANEGLVIASKSYDPTTGFKFISYAIWRMQERIHLSLYKHSRTIKIPAHKITLLSKIGNMQNEFINENGRMPTTEEIQSFMRKLDTPVNSKTLDIDKMLNAKNMITPLENGDPSDTENNYSPINYTPSNVESYLNIKENDSIEIINRLLKPLDSRERLIVCMKLGLGEYDEEYSYKQIGDRLEVTGEAIRLSFKKAMHKIRVNNHHYINRIKYEL